MKNLLLLATLTLAAIAHAKPVIHKASIDEAEKFRVEKPTHEKKVDRSFAGGKAKKDAPSKVDSRDEVKTEDSAIQYWKYSE